jgi:antitoxin component YwqK of YwqJK toxin-antitoxin module
MNNIEIKIVSIIICTFCTFCSGNHQTIEFKEVKNKALGIIEKGAEIDGIKEGYWITLSAENNSIKIESYYMHGKLNGPIKSYSNSGYLMSEGGMVNDSSNGVWTYYFGNGKISCKGSLKNGERKGIWDFYIENGQLDKKVLYENGSDSIIVDNHLSIPIPQL